MGDVVHTGMGGMCEFRPKAEPSAIFSTNEINDRLRVMPHTMRSTPMRVVYMRSVPIPDVGWLDCAMNEKSRGAYSGFRIVCRERNVSRLCAWTRGLVA